MGKPEFRMVRTNGSDSNDGTDKLMDLLNEGFSIHNVTAFRPGKDDSKSFIEYILIKEEVGEWGY